MENHAFRGWLQIQLAVLGFDPSIITPARGCAHRNDDTGGDEEQNYNSDAGDDTVHGFLTRTGNGTRDDRDDQVDVDYQQIPGHEVGKRHGDQPDGDPVDDQSEYAGDREGSAEAVVAAVHQFVDEAGHECQGGKTKDVQGSRH